MKVVVIGGTGLIGKKLISKLRDLGYEAIAASKSTGVDILTGEGLAEVLKGAQIVVDVTNSPSFEDKAVLEFFETSCRHLLPAEKAAGVGHHIALSIVGADRAPESGYLRAKLVQENLIQSAPIPYTIVRSTQFFEFINSIAGSNTKEQTVHISSAFFQPISADDVVNALLDVIKSSPINGIVEIAGPERFRLCELVEKYFKATNDPRTVIPDAEAPYFGAKLRGDELVPHGKAYLGRINLANWLESQKKT